MIASLSCVNRPVKPTPEKPMLSPKESKASVQKTAPKLREGSAHLANDEWKKINDEMTSCTVSSDCMVAINTDTDCQPAAFNIAHYKKVNRLKAHSPHYCPYVLPVWDAICGNGHCELKSK